MTDTSQYPHGNRYLTRDELAELVGCRPRSLAADLADRCARLEGASQQQTQYAAALVRLSAAEGSVNITAAAKSLKVKPTFLFSWLSRERWIYRRGGGRWSAYQVAIMRGVLEHRTATIHRDDGTDKAVAQVLVTPKGLAELAQKVAVDARSALTRARGA
ncbi:phage antirepressor KilAC domain-containing protein [Burkholderia cenocepacia]|uniref:phage antirepressor KilAC domain-containing protein n=1 Tax=Burkholderia cenocepacia TaxID=95486 RepID=UPI002863C0B0|nr:phage antirepressor KilAC domain-containing protein [Burkholderia cenocepacia]MDR8069433.1 phage antirepressor KilAC domain-containing protein [Burkholderia cenocepacia]